MAAIKYDVSDVEAGGGEQAPPALYNGKIVSITNRKKKSDGSAVNDLEVVVSPGSDFANLWTYIKLPGDPSYEASKWKLREFTDAMGLPPKGQIDPDKLKDKEVVVKVSADVDLSGEYRGRVKNLLKPGKIDVPEAGDEGDGGSDGDLTEADPAYYADWSDEDLKAELADKEVEVTGRWMAEKAIDALVTAAGGDGAEADDDTTAAEDEPTDDYDTWSLDDLKAEVAEKGIQGNISGRVSKEKCIDALRALSDGPTAEDGPEPDDYDTWPEAELAEEIEDRNTKHDAGITISGRKTKEKMIQALRDDNKNNPF